jgi:hypothetical protein
MSGDSVNSCNAAEDLRNNLAKLIHLPATFNNISVISWQSVLLMEETGENHRPAASNQILYC